MKGIDPSELIDLWGLSFPDPFSEEHFEDDALEYSDLFYLQEFLSYFVLFRTMTGPTKFTKKAIRDLKAFLEALSRNEDYLSPVWKAALQIESDYEFVRFCTTNIKIMWA